MNPHRILALADWHLDPEQVLRELERRRQPDTVFTLLVPAKLRALGWIGDPNASRPGAERLLSAVTERAKRAGIAIESALVGAQASATPHGSTDTSHVSMEKKAPEDQKISEDQKP